MKNVGYIYFYIEHNALETYALPISQTILSANFNSLIQTNAKWNCVTMQLHKQNSTTLAYFYKYTDKTHIHIMFIY